MERLLVLWNRLRHLLHRRGLEQELRDEIAFHQAMAREHREPVRRRPFGSAALVMEDAAAAWRPALLIGLERDFRYAIRLMLRAPVFTITAALLLGAGIVLNAVLLTAGRAVLLSVPPQVAAPHELLLIGRADRGANSLDTLSYADFAAYRDRTSLLRSAAAYVAGPVHLSAGTQTVRVEGLAVSSGYFRTLGVAMTQGQDWSGRTDAEASGVAVMSRQCAQRFDISPGASLRVNGQPATLTAVTSFEGLDPTNPVCVWIPLAATGRFAAPGKWLMMIARRAPEATARQVTENLRAVQAAWLRESGQDAEFQLRTEPRITLHPDQRASIEQMGAILLGVALVVLAISAANLCSLLLGRASQRRAEMTMRAFLGASRAVLARQVILECALIGVAGALAGWFFTLWTAPLLDRIVQTATMPASLHFRPDAMTLAFCFMLAVATLPLYALPAALSTGPAGHGRFRRILVTGQVALSCALLLVSALLVRGMHQLRSRDLGLHASGLLSVSLDLGLNNYSESAGRLFAQRLLQRACELPGVRGATVARTAPLETSAMDLRAWRDNPAEALPVRGNFIGPAYFQTLGVRIVDGRDVSPTDRHGAKPVVWINELAARRLFGSRSPIGERLHLLFESAPREIAGVVGDYAQRGPLEVPRPAVFAPFDQHYFPGLTLIVRSDAGRPMLEILRNTIASLDPHLPPAQLQTFDDRLDQLLWRGRAIAALTTVFSALALVMAAAGIYGLVVFLVAQRTREIGIRMALGATRAHILRLTAGSLAVQFLAGLFGGLLLAVGCALVLRSRIPGLVWFDPRACFIAAAVMLFAGALAATPALLRAVRLQPMRTLRHQ